MGRASHYPDIRTDYPDLTGVPACEFLVVIPDAETYNITAKDILELAAGEGLTTPFVAAVTASFDTYFGSTEWRAGAIGGDVLLLDEDNFASNSATAAPTQQSTKVYVDTGLATKAASTHSHTVSQLSDASANGRSLVSAADYAAMLVLLGIEAGATADQTASEMVAALSTLTGEDRLNWDKVKGLSSSGAGALYQTALIASLGATAGQVITVNDAGTALAAVTPTPEEPAPTAAASSSGSITLDGTKQTLTTTTTEDITTISVADLPVYGSIRWIVQFGGSHTLTVPSGWFCPGGTNYTGASGRRVHFIIYCSASGEYDLLIGADLTEKS